MQNSASECRVDTGCWAHIGFGRCTGFDDGHRGGESTKNNKVHIISYEIVNEVHIFGYKSGSEGHITGYEIESEVHIFVSVQSGKLWGNNNEHDNRCSKKYRGRYIDDVNFAGAHHARDLPGDETGHSLPEGCPVAKVDTG